MVTGTIDEMIKLANCLYVYVMLAKAVSVARELCDSITN